jgi:uncharacterized protein
VLVPEVLRSGSHRSSWSPPDLDGSPRWACLSSRRESLDFRYKSHSLGKVVSSPFPILVKVVNGQVTFLQFQEDSYATAASFRKDGS